MANVGAFRGVGQLPFLPRSIADNNPALDGVPLVQDGAAEGAARSGSVQKIVDPIADRTASGFAHPFIYGESITIGQPLYVSAANTVKRANATAVATMPCVGIALEAASGGYHDVLMFGIWRDDTQTYSTINGFVYPATTVGTWTQTQPSATDSVIQVVGLAIASHVILFCGGVNYFTAT